MEHLGARPRGARLPQLDIGLGVAGDQHGRDGDRAEGLDRALEPLAHRREVAGADHHVRLLRHLYEALGSAAVPWEAAEGE